MRRSKRVILGVACALGACQAGGARGTGVGLEAGRAGAGSNPPVTPGAPTAPALVGGAGTGGDATTSDGPYTLAVSPAEITITGADTPSASVAVTFDGQPVPATYRVLEGEFGSIDPSGRFTPSGALAGKVEIEASIGDWHSIVTLIVRIQRRQNGASASDAPTLSAGGIGGVGGEGVGPAVGDASIAALDAPPSAGAGLALSYPYDGTVFPLGLLPPLLQWSGASADDSAVRIRLYNDYYDYVGYFARPGLLAAGSVFQRHPIPEDVWQQATRSAQGATLSAQVTVLRAGVPIGPLESSWGIARGRLRGSVYYQSYGTALVNQTTYARVEGGTFGGATLVIRSGAREPEIVAGGDGGETECRVCHSVSADGNRMIAQHGEQYAASSSYALDEGNAESRPYPDGLVAWIGMTRDGALGLTNSPALTSINSTDLRWNEGEPAAQLIDLDTGAEVPSTGLRELVSKAALPAFAADSSRVAFNFYAGPGNAQIGAGDGFKLVTLDFDGRSAFSNPRLLWTGDASSADTSLHTRPGWPSFLPDGRAVVFNRNWGATPIDSGIISRGLFTTWGDFWGSRQGDLWLVDIESRQAHALDAANGLRPDGSSYLPALPATNHGADHQLNYEPSISPISSGGYAWMVFVSRRLYGNVATIDPYRSNPRYAPLTQEISTKKLWVAAIDLDAPPGSDPSHPAFYLPGQELIGVNSRGFWVLDPCKADGSACDGGDECCGGYCQAAGAGGALICSNEPPACSNEFDTCFASSDCCNPALQCLAGRCSVVSIR
jgi:hypothetical protein